MATTPDLPESSTLSNGKFTPTEQRILAILADGMAHTRQELHGCLYDELGGPGNLRVHICNIRKKLLRVGQTILCELYRGSPHYRHVRLLASPYKP